MVYSGLMSTGISSLFSIFLITYLDGMDSRGFHQRFTPKSGTNEEDFVEKMIKDTGCLELHHQVQTCIFETGDWRKCQNHVEEFRKCMDEYNGRKKGKSN